MAIAKVTKIAFVLLSISLGLLFTGQAMRSFAPAAEQEPLGSEWARAVPEHAAAESPSLSPDVARRAKDLALRARRAAARNGFLDLLALAEAGDFAAASTLFARTKGCGNLPLDASEVAARKAHLASLNQPDKAAIEDQLLALRRARHPHCEGLSRWEADKEMYFALLAARLGNNEARVHYWLNGEPVHSAKPWQRDDDRASFEREANALLDAAVADGDGMALIRRAESYYEGRYVTANAARAYAFGYANLRRRGPVSPQRVAELRSAWASDLSADAASRAEMLGEEIFQRCCAQPKQQGGG